MLLDIRLPGTSGLVLLDELVARVPTLPVILISGHADVATAVRGMKQGAIDVIEKPFSEHDLLKRIQEAMRLGRHRTMKRRDAEQLSERFATLTDREREVMEAVVRGKLNKQIAHELDLSPKTIEVHRAHVMEKMAADSLADLVRMAVTLEKW